VSTGDSGKVELKKIGSIKRRPLSVAQEGLVKVDLLSPDQQLPLVIQPAMSGVDLVGWATNNHEMLEAQLLKHGGILFRGFDMATAGDFERFIESVLGESLEYRERSSPRNQVQGNIYTSTEHPADQRIYLHNENSYQKIWPLRISFFCVIPAERGGATPIADVRKVYQRIDPAIRERLIEKKVMYVRNFGAGLSLPWQTVFQTEDKAGVEAYCRQAGIAFEWYGRERLRTRRVGPMATRHPVTQEMVWFNHATFFHVSTLEPTLRDALLSQFAEDELPSNTFYGDGSPFEPSVLDELRQAYDQETIVFPWQKGDLLMLDNMLVAHGRESFAGPRKILTAMTTPTSADS
jgi:alpha-ketoglutarate-dependent taurine dioxygenase